jgi:cytosine deaminase
MNLFVRNTTLPDGRTGQDLRIASGRIEAIGAQLPVPEGAQVIEAGGLLLSPPFVDAHFHMDATLSHGLPRINKSGTLLEGIALWGELKPLLTQEALVERALRYCDWAVA